MKISRLLSKKNFSIIFVFLIGFSSYAEDKPVDIWNLDKEQIEENISTTSNSTDNILEDEIVINESSIYKSQNKKNEDEIRLDQDLTSSKVKIVGLYDPEDYGLDIDMWLNSDGDQLKNLISKLNKIKLSDDAREIVNISMLTNAYYPKKNISNEEFLKFKSDWLIKNSDLNLIEKFLVNNQIIDVDYKLTKFLVDQYLSNANIKKACNIFLNNSIPIENEYLSKFNIFCLIDANKKNEAQLILDLKREQGFKNKYFETKINFLLGYSSKIDNNISEKTLLDFHIAYKANPKFTFEPTENTDKIIWKYLSSFNLLNTFQEIEISELEKISMIEKAVHNKNYPEKDLLQLYKRFQFNINQLLNAEKTYKSLTNIEARALIYQKILLESEMVEKFKLLKILKDLFKNDNLNQAFDIELKKFLKDVDPTEIPDNLTSFYYTNIKIQDDQDKKIKFNNNILHQSKLINYFNGDFTKSKITKDVNNFLKKIKKDKKYFLSKRDIIFIESLKADGIEISEKYNDLYKVDNSEIPSDIQVMINNNEKGAALLRIAEVIGQDKLERMDDDTIYFIITTLNQLNIDLIRNKILLKVLPLKV
tara:strand:- start:16 stop:1791 length:1776 start_codon:yes stop_codon:yes gene_type:complete